VLWESWGFCSLEFVLGVLWETWVFFFVRENWLLLQIFASTRWYAFCHWLQDSSKSALPQIYHIRLLRCWLLPAHDGAYFVAHPQDPQKSAFSQIYHIRLLKCWLLRILPRERWCVFCRPLAATPLRSVYIYVCLSQIYTRLCINRTKMCMYIFTPKQRTTAVWFGSLRVYVWIVLKCIYIYIYIYIHIFWWCMYESYLNTNIYIYKCVYWYVV